MKKLKGTVIITTVIAILYFSSNMAFGMSQLVSCFKESKADFIKMDVGGSGKIKTGDSLEKIVLSLYNAAGYSGKYVISCGESAAELKQYGEGMNLSIKAKKIPDDDNVYISFLLSHYDKSENIINIRRTVCKAFNVYGVKPSFSSLIQGRYNEKLSINQMKEKTNEVFLASGASYIDGINDEKLVSFYGYVPGIPDKVKTSDKYVNLHIAMRYSKADGCTYIWIGSPIIVDEY